MATVNRDLRLAYRLGTTYADEDTSFNFITPASDADGIRHGAQVENEGELIAEEMIAGASGSKPAITITPKATQAVGFHASPYADIYERIWTVPRLLNPTNPEVGVGIPFILWSAYRESNTLTTIGATGDTGLTLDISAPLAFDPVEEKTVNVTIGASAPALIDAQYTFTFTNGSDILDFETTLIEWLTARPDQGPMVEIWEFKTDVIRAQASDEQRIASRQQPRRKIEFSLLLEDDAARREWYDRLYIYLESSIVIPFWQYDTKITTESNAPDTKIYFDRDSTDFRDGDLAIIRRPSDGTSYLLKTSTIDSDGANLTTPLTVTIQAGDRVAPGFAARIDNRSGLRMRMTSGDVRLRANLTDARGTSFDRPNSTATITTFDSLNVLDKKPIVTDQAAEETIDIDPTLFDNGTGKVDLRMAWTNPFVDGDRTFNIQRATNATEMDYWRDFITQANGKQVSFLMPTWRDDLVLDSTPVKGSLQITVQRANYATKYFPYDTYTRLMLTNPSGTIVYRVVSEAEAQAGDVSLLTLATALPNEDAWGNGFTISFLNRVRFNKDTFKLTHFSTYTELETAVRTVNE